MLGAITGAIVSLESYYFPVHCGINNFLQKSITCTSSRLPLTVPPPPI